MPQKTCPVKTAVCRIIPASRGNSSRTQLITLRSARRAAFCGRISLLLIQYLDCIAYVGHTFTYILNEEHKEASNELLCRH